MLGECWWKRQFTYLSASPHGRGGQSRARPRPSYSQSDGGALRQSYAPEGLLSGRAEKIPLSWHVCRDSGRVLSVPGVQSLAWSPFSSLISLKAGRRWGPCHLLPSTPEQGLSTSPVICADRTATYSRNFQPLLQFRSTLAEDPVFRFVKQLCWFPLLLILENVICFSRCKRNAEIYNNIFFS